MPSPLDAAAASAPVWVLAETARGHVEKVTFELLGDAKKLAPRGAEVVVACGPEQTARYVDELAPYGATRIHVVEHALLERYSTDGCLAAVVPLLGAGRPRVLFVAASANGRDLAPRLAARTGAAYLPHALTLRAAGDRLEVTRVTHGGAVHVQSTWDANTPFAVVTMRPGVADPPAPAPAGAPDVVRHPVALDPGSVRVRVIEEIPPDPRVQDLREAERIVAGGRGVGGAQGFAIIEELAEALDAAVAASRVAVDLGWVPYERQVGQTGKTVAPRLYVAAGISGASHHLMGMRGSETIVAVNSDRKAPIFAAAHFGVVGDLHAILPELARRIRGVESAATTGAESR